MKKISTIKPFGEVKTGDIAIDYSDEKYPVIAKGKAIDLLKYDGTGAMASGIEEKLVDKNIKAIAVRDEEVTGTFGETLVYVYGYDGAYVKK